MAFEIPLFCPSTFTAGVDLSAAERKLVKLNGTGTQVILAGANEFAIGALKNAPKLGEGVQLEMAGIVFMTAGAAVAVDDFYSANASGDAIANNAPGAGEFVIGKVLTPAAAAGELIAVTVGLHGFRG